MTTTPNLDQLAVDVVRFERTPIFIDLTIIVAYTYQL